MDFDGEGPAEAPFEGYSPVIAVDIKLTQGTTQGFSIGAAVWQRRQHQTDDDALPLEEKARAPAFSLTVFEFLDGAEFLNLDSLLLRVKPRWALLNPKQDEASKLKVEELLDRAGVETCVPSLGEKAFRWPVDKDKKRDAEQELASAVGAPNLHSHVEVMALKHGLDALCCVLSELRPLGLLDASSSGLGGGGGEEEEQSNDISASSANPHGTSNLHELGLGRLDGCMRLDSAAADAVMLLPDKRLSHRTANGSLYDLLNHCATRMGSRLLESWLRQPLVDAAAIARRHDIVGGFKDHVGLRADLKEAIKSAPDLDALVVKLRRVLVTEGGHGNGGGGGGGGGGGRRATLADIYKLYCFAIRNLPAFQVAIDSWLEENGDDGLTQEATDAGSTGGLAGSLKSRFWKPLHQCSTDLHQFKQLVEHVLDFDALPEDLRIKPQHSPALADLAEDLEVVEERLQEIHQGVQEEWRGVRRGGSKAEVRLERHKEEGYVMRLPSASDEQLLRKEMPDVQILGILKNGVVFTTAELREAAGDALQLRDQYAAEQSAVAEKVIATAATYVSVVESAARCVAELDVLLSFAHAAAHCPGGEYVRPTFVGGDGEEADSDSDSRRIKLVRARHPCVEMQDGIAYIPNEYEFDRESSRFQIVTGPNMGGKSTYIRGLGSIVVMAQIGSFVPCDPGSELPLVDSVLARVGAGDYAARGLSTFMAEMLEASTIVRTATERSLVIIDELGRGTSTFDGFGLAWAISQFMVSKIQCWTLFATHFHELTTLAESERAVVNRHVSAFVDAASEEVTFLYEIQEGPCLQSYGTHVARMAHFPETVVNVAVEKAKKLEDTSNLDPSQKKKRKAAAGVTTDGGSGAGDDPTETQQDTPQKLVKLMRAVKELPLKTLQHPQRVGELRKAAASVGLL